MNLRSISARALRIANPLDRTAGYALPHVLIAAGAGALLTLSGLWAAHHLAHGGYNPGPMAPRITCTRIEACPISGSPVPASHSLARYIVRLHNQGSSNSCVAQTLSAMTEIMRAEGGHRVAYSPGDIWDALNGGGNNPLTYNAAFGRLDSHGDAPLSVEPNDGVTPGSYPEYYAGDDAAARPQHTTSWSTVSVGDSYTIERLISSGYPLAFAAPWDSTWVNHWSDSRPLPYLGAGTFEFWHSVTIVAYSPYGVEILNSWPGWGNGQTAWISWGALANTGGAIAVGYPSYSRVQPKPKPAFPLARWRVYTARHHKPAITPYARGKSLGRSAMIWWNHGPAKAGGVVSHEQYIKPKHGAGYVTVRFQFQRLTWWPGHSSWVKWQRVNAIH